MKIKEKLAVFVLKYLGGGYLEKLLALLPANGKKTYISLVLTILLTVIASLSGVTPGWLMAVVEALQGAGGSSLIDTAALASDFTAALTALFALHKQLKALKASFEQSQMLEQQSKGPVQ